MSVKNFWGEPDDIEPLPDWMNPETARRYERIRRSNKTMNESILEALRKPLVPIVMKDPTESTE